MKITGLLSGGLDSFRNMELKLQLMVFCFFTFGGFYACNYRTVGENSGIVVVLAKEYDSSGQFNKKSDVLPEFKIWYRNNTVIEEIKKTHHHTDSNGIATIKSYISHYTYVDLTTGSYYDYWSLSDTAKFFKKYSRYDKKDLLGFNFYDYHGVRFTRVVEALADTNINGIPYKPYRIFTKSPQPDNPAEISIIAYTRCDKTGTVFDFGRGIGRLLECPITRMDYLPVESGHTILSFEIEFITDRLNKNEIKIFDAWEKNAKNNPVKR